MSNAGITREKGNVEAGSVLTDNKLLRGDGLKSIQDSGINCDDSDNLTNITTIAVTDAPTTRTNLGLGSISTQAANAVSVTGGSVSGITDFAVADGGTGASTSSDARTNLGLGTIATQDANSVAITGGSVTGITDLVVADGGTGVSSNTAYAVLCGGTTGTGAVQSIAALGAAGTVLTSNGPGALPSMQAAAAGGGNAYQPGILNSANIAYLGFPVGSASTTTFHWTSQRMILTPLIVSEDVTITKLYVDVTTAAAGAQGRMGIYKFVDTGTFTLEADFGTFSAASTGIKTQTGSHAITTSDKFYMACTIDENGGAVQVKASASVEPIHVDVSGASFATRTQMYIDAIDPAAALPATAAVAGIGSAAPMMLFGIS